MIEQDNLFSSPLATNPKMEYGGRLHLGDKITFLNKFNLKRIGEILNINRADNTIKVKDERGNIYRSVPISNILSKKNTDLAYLQMAKGGLFAPNGQPSNLTPEQYKLVRSPEFLAWFGNWIDDPEHSSKIVDENGEPLPVFHGSDKKFTQFKPSHNKAYSNNTLGFYFEKRRKFAEMYGKYVSPFFLNIRNIKELSDTDFQNHLNYISWDEAEKLKKEYLKEGFDGIDYDDLIYVVFNPNQIKLSDGSNKTFDANDPDIRFEQGGNFPNDLNRHLCREVDYKNEKIEIYFVNGEYIRNNYNDYSIEFTMGGHYWVYDFIPENEVWLDENLESKLLDVEATIEHELSERHDMKFKGLEYDKAHLKADKVEQKVRDENKNNMENTKTEAFADGGKFWSGVVGKKDDFGDTITDKIIDAPTTMGRWALMTPSSYDRHGSGTIKNMYQKQPDGKWLKVTKWEKTVKSQSNEDEKFQEKEGKLKLSDIPKAVKVFMPEFQQKIIVGSEEHWGILEDLEKIINEIPKTYETEDIDLPDKITHLHYFKGSSDWYIIEKDAGDTENNDFNQTQAYGYAVLNGDLEMAEYGYINIEELKENKVELDFFFEPTKMSEIFAELHKRYDGSSFDKEDHQVETENEVEVELENKYEESNDNKFEPTIEESKPETKPIPEEDLIYIEKFDWEKEEAGQTDLWNKYHLSFYYWDVRLKVITVFEDVDGEATLRLDINRFNEWLTKEAYAEIDDLLDNKKILYKQQKEDVKNLIIGWVKSGEMINKIKNLSIGSLKQLRFKEEPTPVPKPTPEIKKTNLGANMTQQQKTEEIRKLLDYKGLERNKYIPEELIFIREYEGMGGLAKKGYTEREILDQFFTPYTIIEKMWGLADKHNFKAGGEVCEPCCGVGRFLEYAPKESNVTAYEIDKYSWMIAKLTFPKFTIINEPFETMFFQGKRHVGIAGVLKRFDLVIGNPPYRDFASELSHVKGFDNQSEAEATKAKTFDQYFIMRGVDLLKTGGLLIFIIPNSFLSNKEKYNDFKKFLSLKAKLIDAYRLPNGVFANTTVGTDIVVFQKKNTADVIDIVSQFKK